ncbi:MAG: RrF2 family transcriptional regulator [Thermoproteota archaeon]
MTTKSEYALLALLILAKTPQKRQTIKQIAQKKNLPQKYLETILLNLKRNGYVKSTRGRGGGYKLAKLPSEINVAEIVRIMDGPIAPVTSVSKRFHQSTPTEKSAGLSELLAEVREIVVEKMENTPLDKLAEREEILKDNLSHKE